MARARSPNRDKAYELWLKSDKKMPLKDIADKLDVSEAQVRKWKSEDKWDSSISSESQPKRSKGGQKGNQNSVTHGAYRNVYLDLLDEDEQELIQSIQSDEEKLLEEQIALLTIRERRLLKSISRYRTELKTEQVHQRETEVIKDSSGYTERETISIKSSAIDVVLKLEAELTKVQGKKTKCIESLAKIRNDRLKGNDTKETDVAEILRGVFYGDRLN